MAELLHPNELIHRLRLNKHRCFVITGRPLEVADPARKSRRYHLSAEYRRFVGGISAVPKGLSE